MKYYLVTQYNAVEPKLTQAIASSLLKQSRRASSAIAHRARYSDKYQLRRSRAISLYQQGGFRNKFEASLQLVESIHSYSLELGIPPLKPDSAQETIYKWLCQQTKIKNPIA